MYSCFHNVVILCFKNVQYTPTNIIDRVWNIYSRYFVNKIGGCAVYVLTTITKTLKYILQNVHRYKIQAGKTPTSSGSSATM